MDATDVRKKLITTLRDFETVMVATTAEDGSMHARPMVIADIDAAGEVWFVTGEDSAKLREVEGGGARALVTGQGKGRYASLSGRIDVIHDPTRVRALWKDAWKTWLPDGGDAAAITLLRLRPEIGEYWDDHGRRDEAAQHAKVPL